MLVMNRERKLFLGERFNEKGKWQFPQGGVEPNLSLEENVIKELNEELGASSAHFQIVKQLKATHQYDFSVVPDYAVGVWRGQTQTFWLVQFIGSDSEINFSLHTPEFNIYRWCSAEEVRKLAEPKRVPGYEAPLKEYEEFLSKERG